MVCRKKLDNRVVLCYTETDDGGKNMTKICALLLAIVCLSALASCNVEKETTDTSASVTTNSPYSSDPNQCAHKVEIHATCTKSGRCIYCSYPVEKPLGHSWDLESGCCLRCQRADPLAEKTDGVTRVVCVGDSITKGGYWENRFADGLDSTYEVIGLGVNGATGLAEGLDQGKPWAYTIHDEYQLSLRYNPDIVVIMLGTNDTKGPNYKKIKADGGAQYKVDMTALIESYQALNAQPQIFLALPPTIYREWTSSGINNEALNEMLLSLLTEIAEETGAVVIDTHTATADLADYFPDGVHPNADGKNVIARTVADAILANR